MATRTKIILIGLFVGLCIAGLCFACLWGVDKVLPELSIFLRVNPYGPDEFPDTDIVFQVPTSREDGPDHTLGFINADGSGLTYLTIEVYRKGHWGGPWPPQYPMMTGDNSTLIFRASEAKGYSGDIFIIRAGQKAVECAEVISEGRDRLTFTANQTQLVADLVSPPFRIAVFDLDECHLDSITPIIYDSTILDYKYLDHGAISSDGRMFAFVVLDEDADNLPPKKITIFVHDLDNGEEVMIGEGVGPAWSPDGQWLAYTGSDGIYVVRPDGTGSRQVVPYLSPLYGGSSPIEQNHSDYWPPLPSWSPDGEWLVYHKCTVPVERVASCYYPEDYALFIVNIATGEETLLIEGGLNPYWRWP